jgi:hypothetical protein
MTAKTALYMGDKNTNTTADTFTVYRWDAIEECWVPAGLHYSDGKWETFNLKSVYIDLKNTDLYKKY